MLSLYMFSSAVDYRYSVGKMLESLGLYFYDTIKITLTIIRLFFFICTSWFKNKFLRNPNKKNHIFVYI